MDDDDLDSLGDSCDNSSTSLSDVLSDATQVAAVGLTVAKAVQTASTAAKPVVIKKVVTPVVGGFSLSSIPMPVILIGGGLLVFLLFKKK